MRIAVLTAFWQRPQISRVYWAGIRRLERQTPSDIRLEVVAALSPGDEENMALALAHSTTIEVVANEPLAAKWNAASTAARDLDPDYVLIMGSDDLLSDTLYRALLGEMRAGTPHHGVTDLYVWDSELARAGYWPGYRAGPRTGRSIGLGRIYNREIMEACDWRLWPNSEDDHGMDGLVDERLKAMGIELKAQSCAAWGGVALDVKSKQNIWPYDRLNRFKVDPTLVRALFPELGMLSQG